jgi:hypothetical protein
VPGVCRERRAHPTLGVSEIPQRYQLFILLLACVSAGCRGNSTAGDPAAETGGGSAEAGEPVETPSEDLDPGEVEASGEYAAPAEKLMEQLKASYPGVEFSVGWTVGRAHVTIHEGTASGAVAEAVASDRKALHDRIVGMCLAAGAPATKEIWVSSKSEAGSVYSDKGEWETYRRLFGGG